MSNDAATTGGVSITEGLVTALAATWRAIQHHHPEVPDVVLTLGSGTLGARRGEINLGHFAAGRWHTTAVEEGTNEQADPDAERPAGMAELFVGGEGLRRGAPGVLGTLLHEAAHGLANARAVQDTSRQGRYHNKKFAALAEEIGIVVTQDGTRGWSATTVPADTVDAYRPQLAELTAAITAYRHAEAPTGGTGKTSRNNPAATCGCEPARRIRVARAVLAAGPILCGICDTEFTTDDPDADPGTGADGDEQGSGGDDE